MYDTVQRLNDSRFCHRAWYGLCKKVSNLQCGGWVPDWTGEKLIKLMEFIG